MTVDQFCAHGMVAGSPSSPPFSRREKGAKSLSQVTSINSGVKTSSPGGSRGVKSLSLRERGWGEGLRYGITAVNSILPERQIRYLLRIPHQFEPYTGPPVFFASILGLGYTSASNKEGVVYPPFLDAAASQIQCNQPP